MSTNEAAERLREAFGSDWTEAEDAYLDAALAHERSAGAASIDVEALADFIVSKLDSEPYQSLHPELVSMGLARAIRDEFSAWRSAGAATIDARAEALRDANDWLNEHPGVRMTPEDHAEWWDFLRNNGYDPARLSEGTDR